METLFHPIKSVASLSVRVPKILHYEGLGGLLERARTFIKYSGPAWLKSIKREPLKLELMEVDKDKDFLKETVSIIIPTKNAGPAFEELMTGIRKQIGVSDVEIIIIDSDSTDGTPDLAEKYGARVLMIKSEEFNHGLTRNLGTEVANGRYIVFLVQDAVPLNERWLYSTVRVLERNPSIGAVTCRQFPRQDADLFARFANHNHYESMGLQKDEVRLISNAKEYQALSPSNRRRISQLDNVCTCFRGDIIRLYRFENVKYAEDLEIGARLARSGHRLAFLTSTGVIHSHNRPSLHFLKRGYIDRRLSPRFLGYPPSLPILPRGLTIYRVVKDMRQLYLCFGSIVDRRDWWKNVDKIISNSKMSLFESGREGFYQNRYRDRDLENFIKELESKTGTNFGNDANKWTNLFVESFAFYCKKFKRYLSKHNSLCKEKETELREAFFKLMGLCFGLNLGDIMNFGERRGDESIYNEEIDAFLSSGL